MNARSANAAPKCERRESQRKKGILMDKLNARVSVRLASLTALAMAAATAQADLTGDEVTGEIVGGPGAFVVVPPVAIVGAGDEFNVEFVGTPSHAIDIGANSMSVRSIFGSRISTGAGEVLVLSDLDWVGVDGRIIGIENFQTNEEYTINDVTFTDHEVRFNMAPNIWEVDGFVSWDLIVEHDDACPADLDGDGDADADDFFAYLDLFANGDDAADLDDDGDIDADDFFAYLDLFVLGC